MTVIYTTCLISHFFQSIFISPISTFIFLFVKGQLISKQNCRAVTSPKLQKSEFVFLSRWLRNTWNLNFDFWVVRIEKQIRSWFFWEKLRLDNFVWRSADLYWCQAAAGLAKVLWNLVPMVNKGSTACLHIEFTDQ